MLKKKTHKNDNQKKPKCENTVTWLLKFKDFYILYIGFESQTMQFLQIIGCKIYQIFLSTACGTVSAKRDVYRRCRTCRSVH